MDLTDKPFHLREFLPYRLNKAADWMSFRFAAEYRSRYGMTRPEWRTLAALGSSGDLTASQVVLHAGLHKAKISRAVRSLEERGWLTRQQDSHDRRLEHLALKEAGHEAYARLVELAVEHEKALTDLLGTEAIRSLSEGLSAIEAAGGGSPARVEDPRDL